MREHRWLTAKEVRDVQIYFEQYRELDTWKSELRLIADWRKMRELLERLANVRTVDDLPEAEPIWDEINRMLRETSR